MAGRPLVRRRCLALAVAGAAALGALDLARPPSDQVSARVAVAAIRLYRIGLSPLLSVAGVGCRFSPTCSRYAEVAVREHGTLRGGWLAVRRLLRCGPWTPRGTVDPPPPGERARLAPGQEPA